MLKMKTAFIKMLKMEDLKIPVKDAKKMKTAACVGSPIFLFIEFSKDLVLLLSPMRVFLSTGLP